MLQKLIRRIKPSETNPVTNSIITFHNNMAIPIKILQFFWMFPIKWSKESALDFSEFQISPWKVIYAIFSGALHVAHLILYCFLYMSDIENIVIKIRELAMAIEALIQTFIFIRLSYSWKHIVHQWEQIDISMQSYEKPYVNVKRSVKYITAFFLVHLIVEYLQVVKSYSTIANGLHHKELSTIGVIIVITCFISTIHLWRSTREDYVKLAKLCRTVTNHLSWIITFSYIRNIQALLVDVFSLFMEYNGHTISNQSQLRRIAVMAMRVVLVTLCGGFLQDENEEILETLLSVPSEIYNQEVQRFVYHAASREIVLSGLNFFNVSRSLLLRVASSILIYELTIIQFVQNFREID